MIRLIVSDLDGTLLRSDKTYSEKLMPLIDKLKKRGIAFAIATGRAIYTVQDQFSEFLDKGAVICENGSALLMENKILHTARMDKDEIREILAAGSNVARLSPVLCGTKCGYVKSDSDPDIIRSLKKFCTRLEFLDDLEEAIMSDSICKVSFWDGIDPLKNGYERLRLLGPRFKAYPSGENWLDILLAGEDKGSCLRRLQTITGVSPEETMCFGDHMNDTGLMENCRYSYAIKNAHPDIKKTCAFETRLTNDEDGVLYTMMEMTGIRLD